MVLAAGLAAATDEGARFWETFSFNWKPLPGLRLGLEKQLRYEGTFTDLETDVTEFGVGYRVAKWLTVQADYRFIAERYEKRDRIDGAIVLGWRWPTVEVSNRVRLQKEFIESWTGKDTELTFRNRLQVTFRADKALRPYGGGEVFLGLGEGGKALNKYRLTAGIEYDITKKVTLSLFGHYQKDLGETTNESYPIIGGRFHYSF